MKSKLLSFLLLASLLLTSCQAAVPSPQATAIQQTPKHPALVATHTPTVTADPPADPLTLWLDPAVPPALREQIHLPTGLTLTGEPETASLAVLPVTSEGQARWIYALVAAFPTIEDDVRLVDLRAAWEGKPAGALSGHPIMVTTNTKAAFERIWGAASSEIVKVVSQDEMLDRAWGDRVSWAIVPFESIQPRWKVLRVDGMSPLEKNMDEGKYPLSVSFSVNGSPEALAALETAAPGVALLPGTNRDPNKLTVLLMTGVTALVRATGAKMEAMGMTYPAEDIIEWFRSADLRHISNEIAFSEYCPPANPYQETLQFCSRPEYIQLLEYIGANIIDLTGNHMLDWNQDSFLYTLKLYKEHNWPYFAAGENLAEARRPLKIEDHGNKLAFLGCNPVGPTFVWAGENTPGVANCDDMEWLHEEIKQLRKEGYLPIVTFQYHEYYTPDARPWQVVDFEGMAEAGAVIVSGSQAHAPQGFGFKDNSFIHYGLGNLFFDQMDVPVVGTRREFLDRHVFYDGRYLGVDLLTAMLENFAKPRPMTVEERRVLLQDMFTASGW